MNSLLKRYFAEENRISPGAVELRAAWRTSRFVYCVCPFTGRITGQVLRDGGGTNFTLMQVRNVLVRWWTRLQTGSVWLPVTTGLSPPLPYDFFRFLRRPQVGDRSLCEGAAVVETDARGRSRGDETHGFWECRDSLAHQPHHTRQQRRWNVVAREPIHQASRYKLSRRNISRVGPTPNDVRRSSDDEHSLVSGGARRF